MNQIAWQIYGGSKAKANTFIGGVASTITTSGALATKLGIASNRITNFKIVGSDIECRISGSYSIPANCFNSNTSITYYRDYDNLVVSIGGSAFQFTTLITELDLAGVLNSGSYYGSNINRIIFKNCTTVPAYGFANSGNVKLIYIPNATSLGGTSGNNDVFLIGGGSPSFGGRLLYVHPSLATNNAGAPDGDLAYAISQGAIVRYVTNFTAPNTITNLSVGNVYGTAVQLNFTAPTGSTNAIEYYEVYVNGVYNKTVTTSGKYITGLSLNTAYTIEVKPVDIFYNKSTSNVVSQTTLATPVYQDSLVSYYKMENNVLDSVGANNGTATAITYASGIVGQTAVFNGSSSNINCGDSNDFSFGNGVADSPFSIVSFVKHNGIKIDNEIASKRSLSVREYAFYYNNTSKEIILRVYSGGTNSIYKNFVFSVNLGTTWKSLVFSYDTDNIKLYVDGILINGVRTNIGTYVAMSNTTTPFSIGQLYNFPSISFGGQIDEVSIFNTALTAGEVSEINAKLNTGQSLI